MCDVWPRTEHFTVALGSLAGRLPSVVAFARIRCRRRHAMASEDERSSIPDAVYLADEIRHMPQRAKTTGFPFIGAAPRNRRKGRTAGRSLFRSSGFPPSATRRRSRRSAPGRRCSACAIRCRFSCRRKGGCPGGRPLPAERGCC